MAVANLVETMKDEPCTLYPSVQWDTMGKCWKKKNVYLSIYLSIYIYAYKNIYIYTQYMYNNLYIYIHTYMYMYIIYIYIYKKCIHTHTYTCTHTHTWFHLTTFFGFGETLLVKFRVEVIDGRVEGLEPSRQGTSINFLGKCRANKQKFGVSIVMGYLQYIKVSWV